MCNEADICFVDSHPERDRCANNGDSALGPVVLYPLAVVACHSRVVRFGYDPKPLGQRDRHFITVLASKAVHDSRPREIPVFVWFANVFLDPLCQVLMRIPDQVQKPRLANILIKIKNTIRDIQFSKEE